MQIFFKHLCEIYAVAVSALGGYPRNVPLSRAYQLNRSLYAKSGKIIAEIHIGTFFKNVRKIFVGICEYVGYLF